MTSLIRCFCPLYVVSIVIFSAGYPRSLMYINVATQYSASAKFYADGKISKLSNQVWKMKCKDDCPAWSYKTWCHRKTHIGKHCGRIFGTHVFTQCAETSTYFIRFSGKLAIFTLATWGNKISNGVRVYLATIKTSSDSDIKTSAVTQGRIEHHSPPDRSGIGGWNLGLSVVGFFIFFNIFLNFKPFDG